jgi:hypothetical protein
MRSASLFVLILAVILNSTTSSANPIPAGAVCVYGEPKGSTNCNIYEAPALVLHFYYYALADGASEVEFQCNISESVNWIHSGDSSPFASKVGNFQDGTRIPFLDCLTGTIYLGSAFYVTTGDTPACSHIYLANHPLPSIPDHYGLPVYATCGDPVAYYAAATKASVINPTEACSCLYCCPVSIKETSWGRIKALFQQE